MTAHLAHITRFRKCPTYMPGETAQGYLGRLCAFFGYPSPLAFCRDFMLDNVGIQHGEPEALRVLAAITGADFDAMQRSTPMRVARLYSQLNGELLHVKWSARCRLRICPLCAREDVAAAGATPIDQAVYIRSEWVVGIVDRCHRHSVKLVEHVGPGGTLAAQDVGYELLNLLENLDRLPVEHAVIDAFQAYVLGRLGITPATPSPLLDPMTLVDASQVCNAAGHDLMDRRGIAVDDVVARRSAGFEVFGNGVAGLETTVIEMRQGLRLSEMAHKLFPRVVQHLSAMRRKKTVAHAALIDAFTQVCFQNLPYGKGDRLLGRLSPKRWLFDFFAAVAHYGVGEDRMQAFVRGTPELVAYSADRRNDVLLRADVADRLFSGRTPFATSVAVVKGLRKRSANARKQMHDLIMAGIVVPEPGACTATAAPFYSVPGVKESLSRFLSSFEQKDPSAPGMHPINILAASFKITVRDMWALLATGKVKHIGLVPDEDVLTGMRFDENEVLSVLTGVKEPMTMKPAASRLNIPTDKIRLLISHGFLNPDKCLSNGGINSVYVFARQTLIEFEEKYLLVRNGEIVVDGARMMSELTRRGVRPVADIDNPYPKGGRMILYSRREVMGIFREMNLIPA